MNAILLSFGAAITLSAFTLFSVEPLVGKLTLPLLGGGPAVWNVCAVFFQATLLAGYYLGHRLSFLPGFSQRMLVAALFAAAIVSLPVDVPAELAASVPATDNPSLWLLVVLVRAVGLPFLALSLVSPLLQRWFAETSHRRASDPYFLYAASNLGSFAALIAYPLLIEPHLSLSLQRSWLSRSFVMLALLILLCARLSRSEQAHNEPAGREASGISLKRKALWLALAAAPSSLMLGTTTYLTTDAAAFPLLWIVPLALYLLTFIVAFSCEGTVPLWVERTITVLALPLLLALSTRTNLAPLFAFPAHLILLFAAGTWCHGKLVELRPDARDLTSFYLCLSLGGFVGGMFNGLLAPLLFSSWVEYPLTILLIFGLRSLVSAEQPKMRDALHAAGATVLLVASLTVLRTSAASSLSATAAPVALFAAYLLPALFAYSAVNRKFCFFLSCLLIFGTSRLYIPAHSALITEERNFFGVLRIYDRPPHRELMHGTTRHGTQRLDEFEQCKPTSYFHPSGPPGRLFSAARRRVEVREVGVIGLGAGAMACFASAGEKWRFFEIDPAVVEAAERYFSFVRNSAAQKVDVVVGDGRIKLSAEPDAKFDILILDAFSSDAIPVHLLTKEAAQLFVRKLRPQGVLLLHISNRFLNLTALVAGMAQQLGLQALHRQELRDPAVPDKDPSEWAVLTSNSALAEDLTAAGWERPAGRSGRLWTDDYSDLISLMRLNCDDCR